MREKYNCDKVKKGDVIAVWFSCGAASAVAAKRILDRFGNLCEIRVINNPIKEEHPDNIRFLKDVEKWLGLTIEFAKNDKYSDCSIETVWNKQKFMSDVKGGASCTLQLKKEARAKWESKNPFTWLVMGFTAEETWRADRFMKEERHNFLPILVEENLTKKDCYEIIDSAGLKLPEIYNLGFPNANCIGCCKATSVTYWNLVREKFPDVFKKRCETSRSLGVKLTRYKGNRIFLDELPENAKGHRLKNMKVECGIFCEDLRLNRFKKPKFNFKTQILEWLK